MTKKIGLRSTSSDFNNQIMTISGISTPISVYTGFPTNDVDDVYVNDVYVPAVGNVTLNLNQMAAENDKD